MKLFIDIDTPADRLSTVGLAQLLYDIAAQARQVAAFIRTDHTKDRRVLVSVAVIDGLTQYAARADLASAPEWIRPAEARPQPPVPPSDPNYQAIGRDEPRRPWRPGTPLTDDASGD